MKVELLGAGLLVLNEQGGVDIITGYDTLPPEFYEDCWEWKQQLEELNGDAS